MSFRADLAKTYGIRGGYGMMGNGYGMGYGPGMGYGRRGGYGPGNCPFWGDDGDDRN